MKLLRYGSSASEKPGLLDEEGNIRDLSAHIDDLAGEALSPESLQLLRQIKVSSLPKVRSDVRLGPCVGRVGKFVCIGLNYLDHAREMNIEPPAEPVVFMKASSAICGPNDAIIKPRNSSKMDWEVELGIVIGKEARYVDEENAVQHIAGYCVVNDISERHFQLERGGLWDKGKSCDTFGPIGPWLVTADEVPDTTHLNLWLKVNGGIRQNGNTRSMIFRPAFVVHYLSQFMSLQAGDVICTGTPPGVGMGWKPPVFLNAGDVMELGIEGLGVQKQVVVDYISP